MQHTTLFMTFSRQSIRMVKSLWHYLKASQFINAIWLVLKTTDSRAIRRQPCNRARMQPQYCWACDCAQHLWSLIHFTSSVYAKFHFRQYFILLSDKWRCISLTTSLSSFAAGMQIIQRQIYMNKPEQTIFLKKLSLTSRFNQGATDRNICKINSRKVKDKLPKKVGLSIHAWINLNIILHWLYKRLCLGLSTSVQLWGDSEMLWRIIISAFRLQPRQHVSAVGNREPDIQINSKY